MRTLLLSFLLLSASFIAYAQTPQCSGPGRTAQAANSVCGTLTFHETVLTDCDGPYLPDGGCGSNFVTTSHSIWYKFHCYQAGKLGFLISPGSPADDYDWEVMDYTGHPPSDVYTVNLRLSLNLSAITGKTGCTAAGLLDVNCAGGLPGSQFNQMPNLVAGHDYLLMVTNWSNTGIGYDLDFVGGTAVLTNNQPPTITSVGILGCDASKVKVSFSEDILCSTITASGSEFTITGGPNVISGITSDCSLGANGVPSLIINLQAPLPAGNYQLNVNNGTDGNTLDNVCLLAMLPVSIPFTVAPIVPVTVNTITYTGCAPTILNVPFSKPVWCNSVTGLGTEFSILPGNPAISVVQSTCTFGAQYTDLLQIVLQNPLTPGNYQLAVNNGTDGNTFIDTCSNVMAATSIPFTIAQTTVAPVIQSIGFDECHPDKVVVNFDKPVNCASLTAAGSELSVSPGVWPINSISYNCTGGIYTSQVVMNLLNPLPAGNFSVMINNGTDGNTLSDTCYSFMPLGYTKAFTTTKAPAPKYDSLQVSGCNPSVIKVFYSKPVQCSSVYVGGSEFYITGPAPVNIAFVSGEATCGPPTGYSHWILLQLSQPISSFGTYTLHNRWGLDGNSVLDTCNAAQDTTETISFNVLAKPSAVFNSQVNWGCVQDTIVLSHPGSNGANSWTWNFSDGTTATGQAVSHVFPVATPTATVQLIVSNGSCSDTVSKVIVLGNTLQAAFTVNPADTFCINTPVIFTNTSNGTIVNYQWDFGDLTQFNGQNPPTHIYTASNIYNVRLMVTDNHGCTNTASNLLHVNTSAFIDFTGLRPQYCTGNTVVLTRQIASTIGSYVWDNGDGKTFTNQVDVHFTYANEGVYTITLTGLDKYCGPSSVSKTVPVYAVPIINLGPDTVLCQADRILIGVAPVYNYNYLWNTGATSPQIYTDIFTRDYSLTADNHGCQGYDAMHIKVLSVCLIKVPGAFTPNGDGLNDILRAANADLAKNFSFKVFNRFGQLLFSTNNPLEGWDGYFKGSRAETGAYVWMLSYTDPWTGNAVKERGTSILLR